jgi:hypothetical protein
MWVGGVGKASHRRWELVVEKLIYRLKLDMGAFVNLTGARPKCALAVSQTAAAWHDDSAPKDISAKGWFAVRSAGL